MGFHRLEFAKETFFLGFGIWIRCKASLQASVFFFQLPLAVPSVAPLHEVFEDLKNKLGFVLPGYSNSKGFSGLMSCELRAVFLPFIFLIYLFMFFLTSSESSKLKLPRTRRELFTPK